MNISELKFWTNNAEKAESVAIAYCKYRGWHYRNGKTENRQAFSELIGAVKNNNIPPECSGFTTFYRCPNNTAKVMSYISNKKRWPDYVGMYGLCWLAELDCGFMIDSID